jgi:hypothetical protein
MRTSTRKWKLLLGFLSVTTAAPCWAQPVLITSPQTLNPGATTITASAGGPAVPLATAEITVRGTTLTINGRHNLASLRLENEATTRRRAIVTHDANFTHDYSGGAGTDVVNGMWLILTGDVIVDPTCEIDLTGRGFPSGQGPGTGNNGGIGGQVGAGGSHGGLGGTGLAIGAFIQPTVTYGSDLMPTTFGSGGGAFNPAGAGGGCIRIQTPSRVIVEGFIRADGGAAPGNNIPGGGGAGGSIWIESGLIAGRGQVIASGGHTVMESVLSRPSGAGGGGRVRLQSCLNALYNWGAPGGDPWNLAYTGGFIRAAVGTANSPGASARAGTFSSTSTANSLVLRSDRQLCPGESLTISAANSLTNITAVQWYKDGMPLSNSARITGANTNTLTLTSAEVGDGGHYAPQVQTTCGTFLLPGTNMVVGAPMIARLLTSTTPIPFVHSAITYDRNRQRLVLFGGIRGTDTSGRDVYSNQTWEFDGSTWVQRLVPPPADYGGAFAYADMTYDENRGVCVLVGGFAWGANFIYPGRWSVWEWDGSDAGWQNRGTVATPYGYWSNPAIAYDPVRRVCVISGGALIGGYNSGRLGNTNGLPALSGLFEWNGTTTRVVDYFSPYGGLNSVAPSRMAGGKLCYDRARNQMLLFGGMSDYGSSGQLWAWNGSSWTLLSETGPTARWLHGMAYDEARQRVVVWSGVDRARPLGDLWEWDGQQWTQVLGMGSTPLVGPAAAAVAYFPPNRTTYRFGGAFTGLQSQITTYAPAQAWVKSSPSSVVGCSNGLSDITVAIAPQADISFQWYRNGVAVLNGAGGASPGGGVVSNASGTAPADGLITLRIANANSNDLGNYLVTLNSSCGSVSSEPAALTLQACCPADLNSDNFVDDADFVLFATAYNLLICSDPVMPVGCPADLNADDFVDDADFVLFASAYNELLCP